MNFDFFLYEKVKLFVIDSNFTELQHHSTDTKFANIETHTLILYTQYIFNSVNFYTTEKLSAIILISGDSFVA